MRRICPDCKMAMEWHKTGKIKKADGTIVETGYWRCTSPRCGAFRDRHWTGGR